MHPENVFSWVKGVYLISPFPCFAPNSWNKECSVYIKTAFYCTPKQFFALDSWKKNLWVHQDSFLWYPKECPNQISGSNSKFWLENRPLKIRVGKNSEQYYGRRSRAHVWYLENEMLWGSSQGHVWPGKSGSIQLWFIFTLVQGGIVSSRAFFHENTQASTKKKNVGPFFSYSAYLCGPACWVSNLNSNSC